MLLKFDDKNIVSPIKVAYFGHPGSFSHTAASKFIKKKRFSNYLLIPCESLDEIIDYVKIGVSYGIAPYSNHKGGLVAAHRSLDTQYKNLVVDEVSINVHHYLLTKSGIGLRDIKRVVSHPQALLQCKDFLSKNLPNAELVGYKTTSTAARDLACGNLNEFDAVIASHRASTIYKLKILASRIEDSRRNITNFIVLHA